MLFYFVVLSKKQNPDKERNWDTNEQRQIEVSDSFSIELDPYSLSVIRIHNSSFASIKLFVNDSLVQACETFAHAQN